MLQTCFLYPAAIEKGVWEQDDTFTSSSFKYVKNYQIFGWFDI